MDYHAFKSAALAAVSGIGRVVQPVERNSLGLTKEQRQRLAGTNFVTDERWQYRLLADGSILTEISYGRFLNDHVIGVTVFCVGALAGDAEAWDHALSGAVHSPEELAEKLTVLHNGGRERLAAMAEAK